LNGGDHHEKEMRSGVMFPESRLKRVDEVREDRVDTSFEDDTLK
jgi:hypothetical protein